MSWKQPEWSRRITADAFRWIEQIYPLGSVCRKFVTFIYWPVFDSWYRHYVRFEVFTAVTMKNAVFWDVAPCRSYVNRRYGGTFCLHLQGKKIRERGTSVSRWLQTESPVENTAPHPRRRHSFYLHFHIESGSEPHASSCQCLLCTVVRQTVVMRSKMGDLCPTSHAAPPGVIHRLSANVTLILVACCYSCQEGATHVAQV
jgi:hypothetical protein